MKLRVLLLMMLILPQAQTVQAQDVATTEREYDDGLDGLIVAENPSEVADRKGLSYKNSSVLLVVEMQGDPEVPEGYDIEVVQEYSTDNISLVEGYVPVESIKDLANESSVEYIRTPTQPVAQDNQDNGEQDGVEQANNPENTSDTEGTDGFTFAVALLSVSVFALYVRWS